MMITEYIILYDGFSSLSMNNSNIVTTGVVAFSICIKDTVKYKYDKFPKYSVAADTSPIGIIFRKNIFLVTRLFPEASTAISLIKPKTLQIHHSISCHAILNYNSIFFF